MGTPARAARITLGRGLGLVAWLVYCSVVSVGAQNSTTTLTCQSSINIFLSGGSTIAVLQGVQSVGACCQLCGRETRCSRWTYQPALRRCRLKPASGWTRVKSTGPISGRVIRTATPAMFPPPPSYPPPSPPETAGTHQPPTFTPVPSKGEFNRQNYADVLGLSWLFYEAQRSGNIPTNYRISWRRPAHLNDTVPGGWYDAGDYLKLNFPLAATASYLAWGMLEFQRGYQSAKQMEHARRNLRVAMNYLAACHIAPRRYIGQIGHPDVDHAYWGRAEQQRGARPVYVYDESKNASDLLGKVSAALAAGSLVWKTANPAYSGKLLTHARQLWQWGHEKPGLYSDHYSSATAAIYKSSDYIDDMAYGAAWLFKATGERQYLEAAVQYWRRKYWIVSVDWDNSAAATAVLLANMVEDGMDVPYGNEVNSWVKNTFLRAWTRSDGFQSVVKTPKGLSRISWSKWGNLRHASNAAFLALAHANHLPDSALRTSARTWARSQVDYALGTSGRSFVVGYGINPPQHVHHAGASCPDRPASCDWAHFSSTKANPQVLYGALVGGPAGPGDDTYNDRRNDYVTNEVTSDYNAGFTSALAGLIEVTSVS